MTLPTIAPTIFVVVFLAFVILFAAASVFDGRRS